MPKRNTKDLVYRIILFYFVLIGPFWVMGYMYYNNRIERHLLLEKTDQQTDIQLQLERLKELFRHVNADLLTATNHPMSQLLYIGNESEKMEAEQRLELFCAGLLDYNRIFSQARFVDVEGNELLNVMFERGKATVVPQHDLQFKGHRYYVQEATGLKKNEIYVSRFDLDISKGEAVIPFRPVVRFVSPVFCDNGVKHGYFILNLLGKNLLDGIKTTGDENGWKNYFINSKGYYLLGPKSEDEWQFVFDTISARRFDVDYPRLYKEVSKDKNGILENKYGIFEYYNVNATELSVYAGRTVVHNDHWLIISHLNEKAIESGIRQLFGGLDLLFISLILIILMTLAGYLAISSHRRKQIQIQLQKSEHDLRIANGTKDKFISILAHDLKNPLSSIMGFVDLLKHGYEEMPQKSKNVFINSLENSTNLLLRLIDDVLSWARSTTGAMVVEKEPFLVNKLLDGAVKLSRIQAEKKDVKIEVEPAEKVIGNGDPRMIETVIRNLLSNAIKFSHNQSVIEVKMYRQENKVLISIKDYGVGIEDKKIKKLFSLDHLSSTPGTNREKGTGMGLILCNDFIRNNGGRIEVKSQLEKGSEFIISFPVYDN